MEPFDLMKLGIGLYKNSLNVDNYKFAEQVGATHIVAHLTNYFSGDSPKNIFFC